MGFMLLYDTTTRDRQTNDSDPEHNNPKGFCVNQITQFKIQPGTRGIGKPLPRTRSDRDCGFIALEVRIHTDSRIPRNKINHDSNYL